MRVHLDVLELIFEQLDGSDLVASALVSRAFLAGAIPALYSTIEYTVRHAKRAQHVQSPFATITAHDHLAVHVKHIAVHAAPNSRYSAQQVDPAFLDDLAHALRTATTLRSFVCTVKIIHPFLPHLVDKHRLNHLRICAPLGFRQMAVLRERASLHSLALDFPSWEVIDALPAWTASMQKTLAHLTLFMSQDMDASVLNTTLAQLPRLRSLHVIACPRITHIIVLKALTHTPNLRELSFSIFPSQDAVLPPLNFPIPPLTHLSLDIRASYPGLKSLIARTIARLSPRDALAICGGWIGEIKSTAERADASQNADGGNPPPPGPGAGGGPHFFQGLGHGHGHDQADDLPLLSPPHPHPGNTDPIQTAGPPPPNPANPPTQPNFFVNGIPFTFNLGDLNNNNNNNPPGPDPNPPNPDPDSPSLLASFPSTLSILHLPQLSPAALGEVVDHCQGIRVLGIVIRNAFASPPAVKGKGRLKPHDANPRVRTEVNVLANILSRARALRELILDTSATDYSGNGTGPGESHGTLLTPFAVRMLMREAPLLRRIVGEGRVWESPTPTPSSPVPFPQGLAIELTLSKARYGPGAGNNHAHSPPSFGMSGGGHGQVETGNDHWFWLTDSASGGRV